MSELSKRVMWATREAVDTNGGPEVTTFRCGIKGMDAPGDWRCYTVIRGDEYHFTIYDRHDHPIGTIHRPRRDKADGQDGWWEVGDCYGDFKTQTAGPATCFRAFVEWRYFELVAAFAMLTVEA